jgi:hypothetical protein
MNAHDDMSDTDVLSAARDSLSGVPVASPPDVETIMARGRARRHRHRLIPGAAGTAAVAAGAALAVTTLAPASPHATPQASRRPAATHLAAWTVTKLADGNISVTIRELTDPAGLQGTLRADGVPASVTFRNQPNPACRPYPGGTIAWPPQSPPALLRQIFPKPYGDLPAAQRSRGWSKAPGHGGPPPASLPAGQTVIVIAPSALPGDGGVRIEASYGARWIGPVQVVYASPQCTGS